MQKVFQETFRSKNYNTLPLHHEGYAINKKFVIFKHSLKVPKREIFDRSDFPDLYTIKSLRVGDFVVKIKKIYKNI